MKQFWRVFRKSSRGEHGDHESGRPYEMPACAIACVNPWTRINVRDKISPGLDGSNVHNIYLYCDGHLAG